MGGRLIATVAVLASGLVLWVTLLVADSASGSVYWSVANRAAIGSAGLDGSDFDPTHIATLGFPEAIEVDDRHLYWTNETPALGRSRLDGTGVDHDFVAAGGTIGGVTVDDDHVYWSNETDGTIGRARLDGTRVDQEFVEGAARPGHLAVDSEHLYWANQDAKTVGRADLDGSEVDQGFIATLGLPAGLAVDDQFVYWVNANITPDFLGAIGRAGIDGSDPDQTFTTSAMGSSSGLLSGVAVDSAHLYWTDAFVPSIARADLDGGGVDPQFIETGLFTMPRDVAVDASARPPEPDLLAPQTRVVTGPPDRVLRRTWVRYRFAASETGASFECRLDGGSFRPCTSPRKLTGLGTGSHRFAVRATDPAGNTDGSPARDRFRVGRRAVG